MITNRDLRNIQEHVLGYLNAVERNSEVESA